VSPSVRASDLDRKMALSDRPGPETLSSEAVALGSGSVLSQTPDVALELVVSYPFENHRPVRPRLLKSSRIVFS
jgi:hypothetical protein